MVLCTASGPEMARSNTDPSWSPNFAPIRALGANLCLPLGSISLVSRRTAADYFSHYAPFEVKAKAAVRNGLSYMSSRRIEVGQCQTKEKDALPSLSASLHSTLAANFGPPGS